MVEDIKEQLYKHADTQKKEYIHPECTNRATNKRHGNKLQRKVAFYWNI